MTSSGTNYHAHALARGLGVLQELAAARKPLTLRELHDVTELPKPTLVRLLNVMEGMSFVVRVDDRPSFELGHSVVGLAEAYLENVDVEALAAPHLRTLAKATGQTANLGVLDGRQVLHLSVEEPDRPVRFNAVSGSRADAYCTGLGKLLLSRLPEDAVADHVPPSPFPRHTRTTIVTLDDLLEDRRQTLDNGYAYDDEESDYGVRCLSVALGTEGQPLAAISVAGPAGELTPDLHVGFLEHLRSARADMESDGDLTAALRLMGTRP